MRLYILISEIASQIPSSPVGTQGCNQRTLRAQPRSRMTPLDPIFDVDHDSGLRIGCYHRDFSSFCITLQSVSPPLAPYGSG